MLPLLLTFFQIGSASFAVLNPPETQYRITISLLSGDPLGSIEDKSITVLSMREFTACQNQYLQFETPNVTFPKGDEKKSVEISATPSLNADGKIQIRLQVALSPQSSNTDSRSPKAKIEGYETSQEFQDGKVKRFRIAAKKPHDQIWAEVVVKSSKLPAPTEVRNLFAFKMGGVFGR